MPEAFVGRQPIFNADLKVYGYELLFRSSDVNTNSMLDGNQATSQILINTFTEFGLERIVGKRHAFINVTREFLLDENVLPLPSELVVLEVLENININAEIVKAVARLSHNGFMIALDDFIYKDSLLPLVKIADIIKLDVMALSPEQTKAQMHLLRRFPVKLLAEKVETQEQFEALRVLGFDYFQGFFLAKPRVVRGQRTPSNRLKIMQLLAKLQQPNIEMGELEQLISQDVTLSYKILRYLNSAFFSLPRKIESIHQAIVYLGTNGIKRWASLIAIAGFNDRPQELLRIALIRAKMCELLAKEENMESWESFFTVGLMSALDALLQMPMEQVLEQLPLADELHEALLSFDGTLGDALGCALAYERIDWNNVSFGGLRTNEIKNAYLHSLEWATGTLNEIR